MPAANNKDTLERIINMMQLIPIAPRWTTAKRLFLALEARGYSVSKRTIERNLSDFATVFGLISSESPEGNKWSFGTDSEFGFIPAMSAEEALTIQMAKQHLNQHLPNSLFGTLEGVFKKADDVLKQSDELSQWQNKIAVVPPGLAIDTKEVSQDILDVLYQAILENKQVELCYRDGEPRIINIMGIIVRDKKLVLPVIYHGHNDVRLMLAHRISTIKLLDANYKTNSFSLAQYVNSQAAETLISSDDISLKLKVKGYANLLLTESSIGKNQTLGEKVDGWAEFEVTLKHTYELEHWLKSHIQDIQIISPKSVRDRVLTQLSKALEQHDVL